MEMLLVTATNKLDSHAILYGGHVYFHSLTSSDRLEKALEEVGEENVVFVKFKLLKNRDYVKEYNKDIPLQHDFIHTEKELYQIKEKIEYKEVDVVFIDPIQVRCQN